MTIKSRYAKFAKISEAEFRELLKLYCVDLEAVQIAQVTGLNRNTANRYLKSIRQQLARVCEVEM